MRKFPVAQGIEVIDSRYLGEDVAAIYLLRQEDEIAIIETGTKHSLPYIERALEEDGLCFENVSYVIPTHVHLDHAAGAGALMGVCDNATLVVHPRGARHMVDPSKLVAGTKAVYGEKKFNELYGKIEPVESERIIEANDNYLLNMGGRVLKFIDTPGHARHHFCIWDQESESMFTGDTFGVSYREFDSKGEVFIFPTTTPVQFEPEELIKSINNLMKYNPKRVCLTHFGVITPTEKVVKQLIEGIKFFSDLAIEYTTQEYAEEKIQKAMMDHLLQELKIMGVSDALFCQNKLRNDVVLNTQGIMYWQNKVAQG